MTSKERLLTALNLGKPDRLPATVHQWQPYHLKHFMGGISDIEAFKAVGLDAAITRAPFVQRQSANWRVEMTEKNMGDYIKHDYVITTPKGILTYSNGTNEITTWEIEHIIKNDEDINLLKFRPIPYYDKKVFTDTYDELKDDGIIRSFPLGLQGGCFQDACCLYGTQELILKCFDDPDWVHSFLNILLDEKLKFIEESLSGVMVDLVENGGGASSNTVISPSMHEEFCLPYDKKMHDAMRSLGLKTVYHTCGGMTKLTDLILQNGCDASETLSPIGVGGDIKTEADSKVITDAFTGKIAIIGGLDQINILTSDTSENIQKEIKRLFEVYGKNGGYIMSASDHFFHTPIENLKAYADAAKECKY